LLPYILGTLFLVIFIFSSVLSFYLFKLKQQLDFLKSQVDKLKTYDDLGVYKRSYVMDLLQRYIAISKEQNLPLSVMVLDIDSFKEINKFYGHEVGDKILLKIAEILKEKINGMDIVGRLGADEFIVVGFSTKDEFNAFAKELHKFINYYSFDGIKISLSIGISEFKRGENAQKILKRAEEALFLAKRKGGNRVDYLEHFLLFE
jgi:diguanylate cyclase (GGDEF)-like protein